MANIVVLMGPQGAGKGTQAQKLADQFNLPIVATGEILREVAKSDTELGREVRSVLNAGQLVSDEVLARIVAEGTSHEAYKGGYILDGFPRTPPQARQLERIAQGQGHCITVIVIDVPRELIKKRLAGRRTCSCCEHIYNIYFKPPKQEGVCDIDGTPLTARSDDNEEAIAKRLALYDEKTRPLVDYYEESGRLYKVDGTGSPVEVNCRIAEVLAKETSPTAERGAAIDEQGPAPLGR